MSKTLQNIIEKAVSKGFANKNGRMMYYCGRNDFRVSYRPSKDEFYVKAQFVGKKTLEDYIV